LPVHDKGQTEMSDPPDLINHNGRSLITVGFQECHIRAGSPAICVAAEDSRHIFRTDEAFRRISKLWKIMGRKNLSVMQKPL